MKPINNARQYRLPHFLVLSLAMAVGLVSSAQAQRYWDLSPDDEGGGIGATADGVWDASTTANWNVNADGSGANTTWTDGSAAVFSAGDDVTGESIVTVTGAVSTSGITVEEGTVNLAGADTPSLTIGSGGITLEGLANLGASGAGLTSILLSASQTWTNDSATGYFNPSSSSAISAVDNTGAVTFRLDGANTSAVTNNTNGGSTLRMSISNGTGNTVSIEKNGLGTWVLAGNNSFTGGVTINAGTLIANSANAMGTDIVTLNGGGRLDLFNVNPISPSGYTFNGGEVNARIGAKTISKDVTVGGNFTLGGTGQGSNVLTLSGPVSLGGGTRTITVNATGTGNAEISGVLSNGGLVKSGSSQLSLSNASNSYAGTTTVQSGILRVTSNGALGTGASAIALGDATSVSSNFNATFTVGGITTISRDITVGASNEATTGTYLINTSNGSSAWGVSGNITLNQNLTISSGSTGGVTLSGSIASGSSGAKTLTLNNSATGFAARIAVTGTLGGGPGTVGLTKTGAGYVGLTTPHLHVGDTRIVAGILQIDANNLGVSTQLQNSTLDLMAGDAGVLEFRGSTGTTAADLGGLKGSRNLSLQNTSGNAVALTVGGNDQSTAYSGALTGSGSLTKTGTGTLTLSGANTYAGTTTVSSGTLAFENGSQASPITVSSGASLGFTVGAGTTSTNTVTFNSGSTVRITGTPTLASHTLLAASSISGTPVLHAPIAGYELIVTGGNTLVLNQTGASGYSQWATSKSLDGSNNGPTQDPNHNGIANVVEYVLNGEPLLAQSPAAILPTFDASGSNFVFTFTRRVESANDTTQIFEYGTNLIGWTPLNITAPTDPAVTLGPPSGGDPNLQTITVTIPKGANTTLFGRLRVVK